MLDVLKHPIVKVFLIFLGCFTLYSITTNENGDYGIITVPYWAIMIPSSVFSLAIAFVLGRLDGLDKKISHHWLRALTRGILLAIFPLLVHRLTHETWQLFFLNCALFWPTFNITYNLTKGHAPDYVGREATTDKVIRWINSTLMGEVYPIWLWLIQLGLIIQGVILNVW